MLTRRAYHRVPALGREHRAPWSDPGRPLRRLRRPSSTDARALGVPVVGEDVPDGQDPQRRPGRATAAPARPRSPRRCSSPPGRSPASGGSRTATPSATSTPRRPGGGSRCRSALAPFELDGHKVNLLDTPGLRRLRRRRRRRAPRRRPRGLRRVGGRRRRGADRGRVEDGRASAASRARSSSTSSTASARRSRARSTSSRTSSARASRRSQLPIGEEAEFRGVVDLLDDTAVHLRRRHAARAPRGRSRPRWRPRSTRSTTRSSRASSSADDDLMERYLADETIDDRRSSRTRSPTGVATRHGVPGAVRQRDQAHRRRPARAVHRRGRPARRTAGDGPRGRVRVQDDRRPVRRAREPVQGAAGHGEADDVARQRAHASPTSASTSSPRCAARSRSR